MTAMGSRARWATLATKAGVAGVVLVAMATGCAGEEATSTSLAAVESGSVAPAPTTAVPPTTTTVPVTMPTTTTTAPSTTAASTTTMAPVPAYVFPFVGRDVSYGTTHHDYPAVDVFGCGAIVVAPTAGTVLEISTEDRWDPAVNDPATRGGLFVSMLGHDGVRYYVAHLAEVLVAVDDAVEPGSPLGVMGATGNARNSECHTHLGLSWVCPGPEWQVRRGAIWPAPYLDAWRSGEQRSPAAEVTARQAELPTACADAMALVTG